MPGFLRKTVIFLAFVFCVIFAAPGAYAAEQRCCSAGYYGDGSSCSRCETGKPVNSLGYYADSDQGRIGNCKNYEAADCYRNIPAGEAWDNCTSIGIGGNDCVQKLINCPRGYYCLGEKIYRGAAVSSYANNNYWATQCSTTGLYCGPDHSAYSVPSNCSGCIANNLYPYAYGFLFEGATRCGTNYTTSGRGATASSQCSIRYWNISIEKNDGTSNLVTTIYTVKTNGNTSSAGGDLYSGATDPYDQFTGSLSSGSTVISTAPTRTGYTYGGVYSTSSSTGGTQYINASGALTSSGYTNAAQATADKTWYVRWTPKVLTVTLDSKYYATSSTGTGTGVGTNAAPSTIYLKYNTGWYGNSGATTVFSSLTTLPNYQTSYPFYGFYTGKAGTGTRVIDENGNIISGNLTVCSENCTLYAYYPQAYTITFKTGGTTLGTQIFLNGESKALTAVSNFTQPVSSTYGWGFYGWRTNYGSTTRTYTDGQSITPTANMTLYGIWRRPVVFKRFSSATATSFVSSTSYQYYYNTATSTAGVNSVAPTSLVKQTTYNWDPIGWVLNNTTSTTPTISQLAGATPVAITPAKNVVTTPYYALYKRDATLVYNGNTNTGGSTENTVGTQYLNAGQNVAITLPMTLGPNGFTKDGYSFNKWAADSTSGTQYSDGGTFNFPNTAIASSGTYNMYATWNQNCNAVTFNNTTNNSGAIPTSSVLYKLSGDTAWYNNNTCSGTPVTTLLTLPTIAYGSFYGYFLTAISQGTAILSPITHQLSSTWQITEPKTVYAHYRCNTGYSFNSMVGLCAANTITLNWDENGGDAISNGSCTYNGDLVLPAAPTRAGYMFDGWKLANNSTQPAGSTITGGCTSIYTGVTSGTSTAIQAQWTASQCNAITVHIKTRGGYLPGYTNVQDVVLYRHSGHIDVDAGGNAYWWTDSTCNTHSVKNFREVTPYRTLPKKDNAGFGGVYSNNTDEYAVDNLADYVAKDGTFQDIDINSDVEAWAHFVCEPDYAENGEDIKRLCDKNYTITLNSNGATTSGTGALYTIHNVAVYLDSLRAEGHEMTTLDYPITNPTKTGHTFGGYYSGSGGTGTQYISNTGYITTNGVNTGINATANTTWYGKWSANTCTVTFKTGNTTLGTQNFTYGTAQNLTNIANLNNVPVNLTNYWTFSGWSTAPDTAVEYTNGQQLDDMCANGNVTLYGVWTRDIPFKYYGSATSTGLTTQNRAQLYHNTNDNTATATSVSPSNINLVTLTVSGSNWGPLGWVTTTSVTGSTTATLATNDSVTPSATSAAPTYYALYSRTPSIYYNANGGSGTTNATTCGVQKIAATGTASTSSCTLANNGFTAPTGYVFSKWASGSASGTQYDAGSNMPFPNTTLASSVANTMYAIWNLNRFKITFRTVPLNPNNVETYAQYGTADLYTTVGGSTLATVPLFNIPHGSFGGWNANLAPNGQTPNLVPIYTVNNGVAQLVNTTVAGYVQGGVWVTTEDRNLYPIINCDTGYSLDGDTGECVANDYRVAYDCGTGDGTPPAFEYATYNASFTPAVNTCTKTGYNFSGWMVAQDPNDIKPESIAFTWTYIEDKRFSALWTPQTSTVTLNSNGGTAGSVTSVTATYDAAMPTISGNGALPTRPGYTFDGYGDDATTTGGIKYYNADGTSAHTWDKTGNQILYAIWRANCNAVTINVAANGGTINGDSESLVLYKHSGSGTPWVTHENCHNRNRITSLTQFGDGGLPEKTNASYTGVFENQGIPTGAQPIAIDGALDDSWEISGPTTIYAHYDCDEHWQGNGVDISGVCDSGTQYNIYYVMNGGTNYAGAPTSYTYGTGATINGTPTREHSAFIAWCTDSALTDCGSYQEISTTDYGDKTYYVKWECLEGYSANNDGSACVANTITLDWNENGGSAVANGSCTYNGDLILPAAPSRTGYTFVEWVLYDGTAKSAGTTVDNGCVYEKTGVYEGTSTSITARWSPNTYTIAYAGMTGATHGNNHPTSATYDEGVEVSAPSKPGYTFAGWNISGMDTTTHYHGTTSANTAFNTTTLNGTMSTKFRNLRASSGTVTFTATWSTDVYTITLSDGTGTSQSGMPNPIYLKYNTGWYSNSAATTGIGALAATPIKIGYLFEGYYTNSDGTGTQIINNAGTIVANNTAFVANAMIYAKYTAQTGFTVTTTNLAANTTFKFAISAAGQFYVDWGDGTVAPLNRENNTTETPVLHTYATAGVKTITIYGRATGYNAGNSVAVIRFGADANAAVAGVTNTLVSGVSGSLATVFPTISGAQPKFVRTFGTCTNLTGAIPAGLFGGLSGAPVANMFLGTFEMDAGLTGTIPAGLFSAVSGAVQTGTFKDTFKGCTNLTGYVPRGLFATFSGGNVANTHTDMFVDSGLASECPCGMTQYTTGFENTDGKINTKVSCQLGTKIGEYWHNGHCVTECESGITRLKTSNGVDVPLLRAKVGIKNVAFKHNNEVCYSPVETGNLSGHVNLKQGATTYHISEPDGIEPDGFRNLPDGVLPAPGYTVE